MRITNFIKNYPCAIFFAILLLVSISIIFIEAKVYASTEKENKEGCICVEFTCTTLPKIKPSCYVNFDKNKCECGFKQFQVCEHDKEKRCSYIKPTSGCVGCEETCKESDCVKPKCNPGCGNCEIIYIIGCKGSVPYCQYCEYSSNTQ